MTRKTIAPKGEFNVRSYAIAVLRRGSYRTPMRQMAMCAAKVSRGIYNCAACKSHFPRKEIQVDHISCVVPVTGWDGFDGFIERLFCKSELLQILCLTCHKAKSKAENTERRTCGTKARTKGSRKKVASRKKGTQRRVCGRLGKVQR